MGTSQQSQPEISEVTLANFFRRFAHHLENSERLQIAAAIDTNSKRITEICDACKEYAWKALGGAVLIGDNWKELSQPVDSNAAYDSRRI